MHRRRGQKNNNNKEKNNSGIIFAQLIICMVLFISFLSVRYFMPGGRENIDSVMSAAIKGNVTLEDLNEKMVSLTLNNKTMKKIFDGGIMNVFSFKDDEEKKVITKETNDITSEEPDITEENSDLQGE